MTPVPSHLIITFFHCPPLSRPILSPSLWPIHTNNHISLTLPFYLKDTSIIIFPKLNKLLLWSFLTSNYLGFHEFCYLCMYLKFNFYLTIQISCFSLYNRFSGRKLRILTITKKSIGSLILKWGNSENEIWIMNW